GFRLYSDTGRRVMNRSRAARTHLTVVTPLNTPYALALEPVSAAHASGTVARTGGRGWDPAREKRRIEEEAKRKACDSHNIIGYVAVINRFVNGHAETVPVSGRRWTYSSIRNPRRSVPATSS